MGEKREVPQSGMAPRALIKSAYGAFSVRCGHKHQNGENVHLLARPLSAEGEPNSIQGVVKDVIFQQDRFKVTLDNGLYLYLSQSPKVGQKLTVRVKVECLA